ncbi:MAG: exopolysaccharide regulatory tyrosine autokinase VpsO [Thermodesulfovibrionales bacterium]
MFDEKEIHLREYLTVVLKRRHVAITFFAIVFVLTLIITFSATPLYLASTKVLIEKSEPANLSLNPYYSAYDPEFSETQYQLIRSFAVAHRVVKTLGLDRPGASSSDDSGDNIMTGTLRWMRNLVSTILHVGGLKPSPAAPEPAAQESPETTLRAYQQARMISSAITVTPVKNSKIVNISYLDKDPRTAAQIVNAVAKAYIDELLDIRIGSSRYAMKWLTEKADEERARMEKTEKALQEYMRDKDIATLENKLTMVPERVAEIASKLAQAETKRKELETLHTAVKGFASNPEGADAIPAIAADPTLQSLQSQILKAEQAVSELSKKYGPRHPSMVTANEDLAVLKEKKKEQIRRVVASIKNEYDIATANEVNLRKLAGLAKAQTLSISEKFIQYGVLKREAETSRELFDAIVKRIKEQGITQDIQTVNVWVIEKAEVPSSPKVPNRPRNIMLGLILGLLGGVGVAFFVEYLDNTIKSPEEIEQRFNIPVLGLIEHLDSAKGPAEGIVMQEPRSAIAENYRIIRTNILLSTADRPPKHILVTSTTPEEGKTTTAVNLACILAQSAQRVLLIDADLRRPRIRQIFAIAENSGLSTYLAGASSLKFFSPADVPNLQVMPSGPIPPNPSELIESRRMQDLLAELEEKFDFIVWDSPPLFTVSESLTLGKLLSGTVIVTRAGKTTYDELKRGLKALADINIRILGVVINRLDLTDSGRYYHRYYGAYYGSPAEEPQKNSPDHAP